MLRIMDRHTSRTVVVPRSRPQRRHGTHITRAHGERRIGPTAIRRRRSAPRTHRRDRTHIARGSRCTIPRAHGRVATTAATLLSIGKHEHLLASTIPIAIVVRIIVQKGESAALTLLRRSDYVFVVVHQGVNEESEDACAPDGNSDPAFGGQASDSFGGAVVIAAVTTVDYTAGVHGGCGGFGGGCGCDCVCVCVYVCVWRVCR
mmetsp:Transcript_6009/g.9004  ORF Transcript_6009/g.9004 Transcript_6009/m.9004 type:complete len:204 (-) Transcript_6009:36-647(-)